MGAPYEPGVVNWHHTVGQPPIEVPLVMGELARVGVEGVPTTLLVPGFGETEASAAEAVRIWEEEFGRPAASGWISYCLLSPTKDNLYKIAVDVPQALAAEVGQGKPVHMVTHSLGDLATLAAAKAPELFGAVGLDAPHAFSCQEWGKLPVIGSLSVFRPLGAAQRLAVQTQWQLRKNRKDEGLRGVRNRGLADLRRMGGSAWSAAMFAFSDGITAEAVDGYLQLAEDGHPTLLVTGSNDKVSPPTEIRRTLRRAAKDRGHPEDHYDDQLVEVVGLPHVPWCLSGFAKLQVFDKWLTEAGL